MNPKPKFNCDFLCLPSINGELPLKLPSQVDFPSDLVGRKNTVDSLLVERNGEEICIHAKVNGLEIKFMTVRDGLWSIAGTSVNMAVGLERLGAKVALSGGLGQDSWRRVLQLGISNRIGDFCYERYSQTPLTVILIHPESGLSILLCHKPPYQLFLEPVMRKLEEVEPRYIVATGVRPAEADLIFQLFQQGRGKSTRILVPNLTLCKQVGQVRAILSNTDILQVNEEEACALLRERRDSLSPESATHELVKLGPKVVIVTLGDRGAVSAEFANGEHQVFTQEAFPVKVKDVTGAGDGFLVGFLWADSQRLDRRTALRLGSWVAAQNIAHVGGHGGMPTLDQLRGFLNSAVATG